VASTSPCSRRIVEGIAIAGFALASTVAIARVGLEPRDPARAVGVIFAPWVDAGEAFTRAITAGSHVLRFGGYPFIIIVEPETADFARQVKDAGAWLVVDLRVLTACLPSAANPTAAAAAAQR
jgi:hypothetical protein